MEEGEPLTNNGEEREREKTIDPWLPISSNGVSSTSPPHDDPDQWWKEVDTNSRGFGEEEEEEEGERKEGFGEGQGDQELEEDSEMVPPATSTGGGGDGQTKGVSCNHVSKGVSTPGLRKALKGDIKIVCYKPDCLTVSAKQWMCLQCGSIGCGDDKGNAGHAKLHQGTPRSDVHCMVVELSSNLDTVRCLECQLNLDASAPTLKGPLELLRRNQKVKLSFTQNTPSPVVGTPIVLGPPPPPPAPKIEPVKPFTLKGKQNNNRNSMYNRWGDRDSGGTQWPLGLENLGNTCFMNSALQCLSRTRSLLGKLDLYGSGSTIEIIVTNEEPWCVKLINGNVNPDEEIEEDGERKSFIKSSGIDSSEGTETSEVGSGETSPSSAEMDSLLDAATTRSSRKISESENDPPEKQLWKKELKQELSKELRLRLSIPREGMTGKLRHCFRALTRSSESSSENEDVFYSRSVFTPRAIQLAVSKQFRLGHQHDSHELLRTVVDMMKKDQIRAFRLAIMTAYGVKKNEGKTCDPKLQELLKMWDRKLYHKTFVDEIFGGELVTFQQCLQCKHVKRSHEDFLDISLPIRVFRQNPNPNPAPKKTYSLFDDDYDYVINRSVEECLRAYTAPEYLTGSNVVECENCHRESLKRLADGASFEEVFPDVKLETKGVEKSKMSKHQLKKQKQQNKRQNRQSKLKMKYQQNGRFGEESEESEQKDSLDMVEDHFKTEQKEKLRGSEDDSKSNKSGSLDDYVVVQNASTLQRSPTKPVDSRNDMDMEYDSSPDLDGAQPAAVVHPDGEEETTNLSRGLSSSLKSLTLTENGMDVEEGSSGHANEDENMRNNEDEELMDDLDEPAVDGIGNASDVEDEENHRAHGLDLDLGLEEKPISVADYLTVPGGSNSGGADEGFSEGENSSDDKPSQSLSASSSQASISDAAAAAEPSEKPVRKIPVTKCPCSRQQLISRAPECLTLHLKRFQHTARGSSKLNDKVSFPYILNLTEFCSEEGEDTTRPGFKSTFDEEGEVVYSLYGIVEHSGSLHFGHYVAYVKVTPKPDAVQADDSWYYISDSHVSRSTLPQVLQQDAYILFYERIRGPEKQLKMGYAAKTVDYDGESSVRSSGIPYNYGAPSTSAVNTSSNWEENWEDANQQVSSSNDGNENMSITLNYEPVDPVSSTTLYSSAPVLGVDGVVSSTTDADTMDFSASASNAPFSHPIWSSSELQDPSSVFGDMDDEDESPNGNNPVSSSSDVVDPQNDGYRKLEEVE